MTNQLLPETAPSPSIEQPTRVDSPGRASRQGPHPSRQGTAPVAVGGGAGDKRTIHVIWLLTLLPVMVLGFAGYSQVVAPLQEKSFVTEATGLARDLDAIIRLRAVVLDQATRDQEMTSLLQSATLERLRNSLRVLLPDFVSIDVIDREGTIVAMAGELPTSGAGLPVYVDTNKFIQLDPTGHTLGWVFHDDAAGDCFYLSSLQTGRETAKWFLRARFSRELIKGAAARVSAEQSMRATLVPVAAKSPSGSAENFEQAHVQLPNPEQRTGMEARISRSWWGGQKSAEIRLATPGWVLRAEATSAVAWFSRGFAVSACMVVCSILAAFTACGTILRRRWEGAEACHNNDSWWLWRSVVEALRRASRRGAVDLNRSESAVAQPSVISAEEASARPVGEGIMETVAAEAEFLTEVSIPAGPMAAEAAYASLKPADTQGVEDGLETRALSWFEPLPEGDEAAGLTTRDATRKSFEGQHGQLSGTCPEYIEIEWLEDRHEPSRLEEVPDDKNLTHAPSTKFFAGA